MICEKCWSAATLRQALEGGTVAEHYERILRSGSHYPPPRPCATDSATTPAGRGVDPGE